jgi:hypothetical protein
MPTTYRRLDKLTHADTVLYEIDQLRFASVRLVREQWEDPHDAWVYLESFLLHYRNLIEFFGRPNPRHDDVHITNIWRLARRTPPTNLKQIIADGTKLWDEYEPRGKDDKISKYLQHCTMKRVDFKEWHVDVMAKQIEPLLTELEKHLRLASPVVEPVRPPEIWTPLSASTATVTITSAAAIPMPDDYSFGLKRVKPKGE